MDNSDSWERCGKCGGRLDGVLGLCIGECLPKKVSKPKELIPAPQTLWTPITGEASLPPMGSLCHYVRYVNDRFISSLIEVHNVNPKDFNFGYFTHYTILTKPVK